MALTTSGPRASSALSASAAISQPGTLAMRIGNASAGSPARVVSDEKRIVTSIRSGERPSPTGFSTMFNVASPVDPCCSA